MMGKVDKDLSEKIEVPAVTARQEPRSMDWRAVIRAAVLVWGR